MYEPVYSNFYEKMVNNRGLSVSIVPCFGTTITKFEEVKMYWAVGNEIRKEEAFEEKEIFIAPEVEWLLEVDRMNYFHVYITEYTKTVQLPWGDAINKMINQKVLEAKLEYGRRKRTEKRLYFYDVSKSSLSLYTDGASHSSEKYYYCLERYFTPYQAISKKYPIPKESCFILGRVQRTIGTKDGKLMDFIEPIAKFELDYDVDLDWFDVDRKNLGDKLFQMLQFSIQKGKFADIEVRRIENKLQCDLLTFMKRLKKALEAGDVAEIRYLYKVVYESQDCSKENFQIWKEDFLRDPIGEEEIWCSPRKSLWILYENGETESEFAEWIYENISRCTNKSAIYANRRYNFY